MSAPEPVVIVRFPPAPALEADNTNIAFLNPSAPLVRLEAETVKSPAIVAALIPVTKLAIADAVWCPSTCPLPKSTNFCVDELSSPADDDTNTNETLPILNSSCPPADKEPEEKPEEEEDAPASPSMSDHYNPRGKDMKLKD